MASCLSLEMLISISYGGVFMSPPPSLGTTEKPLAHPHSSVLHTLGMGTNIVCIMVVIALDTRRQGTLVFFC